MSAGATEVALARVRGHGQRIIDAELDRLVRKNPQLSPAELATIDQALGELHDRLVLQRLRLLAATRPDLVDIAAALFGAEARLPG